MDEPRIRVTPAELARRLGVTRQAVHAAITAGRLTASGPDGLLDLERALAEFRRNRHPTVGGAPAAAADGRGRSHRDRYWRARASREEAEAALAEHKRRQTAAESMSVADFRLALFGVARLTRDAVRGISARQAAAVAAAVNDALTAAGVAPAIVAGVAAATVLGAGRILDAEGRRLLDALNATVRAASAGDLEAAAASWREDGGVQK